MDSGEKTTIGVITAVVLLVSGAIALSNGVFDRGTKEIERDSRQMEREQARAKAHEALSAVDSVERMPRSEIEERQAVAARELAALRTAEIEAQAALARARVAAAEAERAQLEAATRERARLASRSGSASQAESLYAPPSPRYSAAPTLPPSVEQRQATVQADEVAAVPPRAATRPSIVVPARGDSGGAAFERQIDQMQARIRTDEQTSVYSVQRDVDFLSLAQRALASGVKGRHCKWLISHARVVKSSIGLDTAAGSYRLPDESERIAAHVAATSTDVCDAP